MEILWLVYSYMRENLETSAPSRVREFYLSMGDEDALRAWDTRSLKDGEENG